jgi:RHS repeat-associated protein
LKTEARGQKRSLLRGRRIGVYPGQYYDQETGLHYNYFRYYDPSTGRYVTPDLIGLAGGINLFTYVRANPINTYDLLGLVTTLITTYDYGVGSHSAVHINTPVEPPFLYDPAGSYNADTRGSGGIFEGNEANLQEFIKYHESTGSKVDLVVILTTPEQEELMKQKAEEIGDLRGFSCASSVSSALSNVCNDIKPTFWPGRLRRQAKDAKCKPRKDDKSK